MYRYSYNIDLYYPLVCVPNISQPPTLGYFHFHAFIFYQEAKGGVFAKLWKKVQLVENSATARLQMLNSSQPLAHLGDKTGSLQHLREIGSCDWRTLPEEFFPSGLGIALPKRSPYREMISKE